MTRRENRAIRRLIQQGALGQLIWSAVGAAFGTYHEKEAGRQGDDILSNTTRRGTGAGLAAARSMT
jgi:hypothetical protein